MEELGFKLTKTSDGKYQMTISKEYSSGDKEELITKIDKDLQKLVVEFEKMKEKGIEK